MSKSTNRKFKCMKCGEVYDINTYDSVNVSLDPDIKERCLSGDIFHFECPHCHNSYMLSYPCLYHDQEKKFMVWLLEDKASINSIDPSFVSALLSSGYTLRRCTDINSFIEKIQILDDGLDDRAVEFSKYDSFIDYVENKKGKPEEIDGIYYHGIDNEVLKINIRTNDKGATIMIPYEALMEEINNHKDLFEVDNKNFPVIDSKWIIQIFEASQNIS